jgi:hypothetical protein
MRPLVLVVVAACGFSPAAIQGTGSQRDAPDQGSNNGSGSGSGSGMGSGSGSGSGSGGTCIQSACSAKGGNCNGSDECEIIRTDNSAVACPSNMKCRITCNAMNSCETAIDCGLATACIIDCKFMNTCMNANVGCPNGCTIYCRQSSTCANSSWTGGTAGKTAELQCCAGAGTCFSNTGMRYNENHPGSCP